MTHLHIAGICGTFMGGVAKLAVELGCEVSGCDSQVYPPMSDQLANLGIELREGYSPAHLDELQPDEIVIGNALSRGNPLVEAVLDRELPYCSGPEWLAREVLPNRWVMAVAGTHGKTTTTSLLTWILDVAGKEPGFLIGGVPANFGVSARLGRAEGCFVVEADEYDSAFFDKRSKFVHYRPRTLILNNLEFDHADIFDDLDAIKRQFHHLVRTVPGRGRLIVNGDDTNLRQVLEMGCWTAVEHFGRPGSGHEWTATLPDPPDGSFRVTGPGNTDVRYQWPLLAEYNALNATAAIAAARHAGVAPDQAGSAIGSFRSVKRRLEEIGRLDGVTLYDDFAHHPTAVRQTLEALRAGAAGRVICIFEPRSNTMRMGVQKEALRRALALADEAVVFAARELKWDAGELAAGSVVVMDDTGDIIEHVYRNRRPGDRVVIMSNGGFENLSKRLVERFTR